MKNPLTIKENNLPHKQESSANLEIVRGAESGVQYQLLGKEITIGRELSSDIVLEDKQASRLHAVISREGANYYIKDLNSQNGTLLNNKVISFSELANGDEIRIGDTNFLFYKEESNSLEEGFDDLGQIQPRRSKFTLIILTLVAIGVIYWGITSPVQKPENAQVTREPLSIPPTDLTEAPVFAPEEKKIQSTNLVTADHLYQKGFRELMAKNYLRAIHFFEAALTLYPEHEASKSKLARTYEEITKEIEGAFQIGRRYSENHQWRRAVYYFERAKLLLDKNRDSHTYLEADRLAQEARERLNPPTITALEVEE